VVVVAAKVVMVAMMMMVMAMMVMAPMPVVGLGGARKEPAECESRSGNSCEQDALHSLFLSR
jgi:hypothetical protein